MEEKRPKGLGQSLRHKKEIRDNRKFENPHIVLNAHEKNEILRWGTRFILGGGLRPDFIEHLKDATGLKRNALDMWWNRCCNAVREQDERDLVVLKKSVMHRLEDLYQRSITDKDNKTALAVLKEISFVAGIGRINLDVTGGITVVQLPPELMENRTIDTEAVHDQN